MGGDDSAGSSAGVMGPNGWMGSGGDPIGGTGLGSSGLVLTGRTGGAWGGPPVERGGSSAGVPPGGFGSGGGADVFGERVGPFSGGGEGTRGLGGGLGVGGAVQLYGMAEIAQAQLGQEGSAMFLLQQHQQSQQLYFQQQQNQQLQLQLQQQTQQTQQLERELQESRSLQQENQLQRRHQGRGSGGNNPEGGTDSDIGVRVVGSGRPERGHQQYQSQLRLGSPRGGGTSRADGRD